MSDQAAPGDDAWRRGDRHRRDRNRQLPRADVYLLVVPPPLASIARRVDTVHRPARPPTRDQSTTLRPSSFGLRRKETPSVGPPCPPTRDHPPSHPLAGARPSSPLAGARSSLPLAEPLQSKMSTPAATSESQAAATPSSTPRSTPSSGPSFVQEQETTDEQGSFMCQPRIPVKL